jgi:hypothetical protein
VEEIYDVLYNLWYCNIKLFSQLFERGHISVEILELFLSYVLASGFIFHSEFFMHQTNSKGSFKKLIIPQSFFNLNKERVGTIETDN